MKSVRALLSLFVATGAMLLSISPSVAQNAAVAISPATQGEIAEYLKLVRNTRPGAFAVSPDGLNSFYTWCEDLSCNVTNYSAIALRGCRSLSGADCLILYFRNDQRRPFNADVSINAAGRHGFQKQYRVDFMGTHF